MAGEPLITVVGNATADAELKFLPSGVAVCSFTVASTPRVKQDNEWVDGEPTFFRCTAWRDMAERVGESVTRGMRLIVHGRFKTRAYEKDGEKRTSIEIDVEEVGPSLRYATAKVAKASRDSAQRSSGSSTASDDAWATAPAGDPEPPF